MVDNEQNLPPSSDDIDNQSENNDIRPIMISMATEGEIQRKRHNTNLLDNNEEENSDKSNPESHIYSNKQHSKRSKLKNPSLINDERVQIIAQKILSFKHIAFTLCQIGSFSSKWKHEREKAINQLCGAKLLKRLQKSVKTPTSRPFDYHIKIPPLDFSNITEVDQINERLNKFKLNIHQIRPTYSTIDIGQLIALPPLTNYLRAHPHIIQHCPVKTSNDKPSVGLLITLVCCSTYWRCSILFTKSMLVLLLSSIE
ncbi:unnamed protein product [Rotaria sp. Silwood1]|nr:unnamed protein product [Rotaria sp. Silwood1]CAF3785051.1 unnamed protein product [Rotaria sp. Silwood1]CAF3801899.1 unnamed protein product [Rotaria sp. Silwood1]CAF3821492.1 unnamed protein product [Rotaria sp. Silwood1]CAF4796930.1 unnamed protein product [Rotaria sp. Silwood1]